MARAMRIPRRVPCPGATRRKRREQMKTGQFEHAVPSSPMPGQGSISSLVALVACSLMLLQMLAA
jgi:hypothetical protein